MHLLFLPAIIGVLLNINILEYWFSSIINNCETNYEHILPTEKHQCICNSHRIRMLSLSWEVSLKGMGLSRDRKMAFTTFKINYAKITQKLSGAVIILNNLTNVNRTRWWQLGLNENSCSIYIYNISHFTQIVWFRYISIFDIHLSYYNKSIKIIPKRVHMYRLCVPAAGGGLEMASRRLGRRASDPVLSAREPHRGAQIPHIRCQHREPSRSCVRIPIVIARVGGSKTSFGVSQTLRASTISARSERYSIAETLTKDCGFFPAYSPSSIFI